MTAVNFSDRVAYHADVDLIVSMTPAAVRRVTRLIRRDLTRAPEAVGPTVLPLGVVARVAMEVRL